MAATVDDIKKTYPLPVYYYEVTIDGLDPIAFSEASGLAIEYNTITYKDGLSFKEGARHMPGQGTPVDLTLKKGVMRGDNKLFEWISSVKLNTVDKKDILIVLKDETHSPVVSWKVLDAFPKKLDAPKFDAMANDVAIEKLDLRASDLSIEYH
ncbi:MAG: phage tail protein [Desulfobacterales bacterium]|nr:phage tail protein [Desulfobacterales bacterium]